MIGLPVIPERILGAGLFGAGFLLLWLLFAPLLERYESAVNTQVEKQQLIERHIKTLSEPLQPDMALKYRSFISAEQADPPATEMAPVFAQLVARRGARLARYQSMGSESIAPGLERERLSVQIDGTLKALLDVSAALAELPRPILIETLTVQPGRTMPRADQDLRLTLKLALWREVRE